MSESPRYQGTVLEFSRQRGCGYISMEGREDPVLVRYSAILGEGVRTLQAGQTVTFELEASERGLLSALRVISNK